MATDAALLLPSSLRVGALLLGEDGVTIRHLRGSRRPAASLRRRSASSLRRAHRTLVFLRTGQDVTGQGIPPWEATTTRPGGWVLVGAGWLIADPATRWDVWCQAGSQHVGLRVQVNRSTVPSRG